MSLFIIEIEILKSVFGENFILKRQDMEMISDHHYF